MQTTKKDKVIVGRAEMIALPEAGYERVPARIDTGAKTSSIWASDIYEQDGALYFTFFGTGSPLYDGVQHHTIRFEKTIVASSIGQAQERYKVRLLIKLKGKKIRARVTLADRSQQVYPVLIGRNVLRGKFVVDVQGGKPLYHEEQQRSQSLQASVLTKE